MSECALKAEDQILVLWILAARLPKADLNFAVDFYGVLLLLVFFFQKIGRKHPSRDVIFSSQNLAKNRQKLSHHMTPLSLKNKYF